MRACLITLLLLAGPLNLAMVGQENSKTPLSVESLQLGMKKSDVLAGLAANYKLLKLESTPEDETWIVLNKTEPVKETSYHLTFVGDQLFVISAKLQPDFFGDGLKLGERLWAEFSSNADPPKKADRLQSAVNLKQATVAVATKEILKDGREQRSIYFGFPEYTLVLKIDKLDDGKSWVSLERNRVGK